MKSRDRFRETMRYGRPDRVPYFEEGLRKEVLDVWRRQGMPPKSEFLKRFPSDPRVEIEPELDPLPPLKKRPGTWVDLAEFRKRLNPTDHKRFPQNWKHLVRSLQNKETVRMLRVHRGLFLSMGVQAWSRFMELMSLLGENPGIVSKAMRIQGEFAAELAERILSKIDIDAAIFSEPIGGNEGPLISPRMYADVVLKSYQPLLKVLNRHGVEIIIFRTFANARALIPAILKYGFNCLWACEVNIKAMDYRELRREFGKDLRLIGGIDLDALRHDKKAIDRELYEKVPPLLDEGGYVPLADGRIREDVPFENYVYYRNLLRKLT